MMVLTGGIEKKDTNELFTKQIQTHKSTNLVTRGEGVGKWIESLQLTYTHFYR